MDECPLYGEPWLYDLPFRVRDEAERERMAASERSCVKGARRNGGGVLGAA